MCPQVAEPTTRRPHKFRCPQVATRRAFPTPLLSPILCVSHLRRWRVQAGPAEMEWKLEKSAARRMRTHEDLLWVTVFWVPCRDMGGCWWPEAVMSKELVGGHHQPLTWVVNPHKWPGLATGDAG